MGFKYNNGGACALNKGEVPISYADDNTCNTNFLSLSLVSYVYAQHIACSPFLLQVRTFRFSHIVPRDLILLLSTSLHLSLFRLIP